MPTNPMNVWNDHPKLDAFMNILTQTIKALQTRIHPNIIDMVINEDHEETELLRNHELFSFLRRAFGEEKDSVEELCMKILLRNLINHPKYKEFQEMKSKCIDLLKKENPGIKDDTEIERLLIAGNKLQHEVFPFYRTVMLESERQRGRSKDQKVGVQDVSVLKTEKSEATTSDASEDVKGLIKEKKSPRIRNFQESILGSLEDIEVQKTILDVIRENESIWKIREFLDMNEDWEGVGEEVYRRTGKIVTVPQLRFFWKRTALNFAGLLRECICTLALDEKVMEKQLNSIDLYSHISFYREQLADYENQLRNEKSGELVDTRILQRIEQDHIFLSDYDFKNLTAEELSRIGELNCVFTVDQGEQYEAPLGEGTDTIRTTKRERPFTFEESLTSLKRRRSDEPGTSGKP